MRSAALFCFLLMFSQVANALVYGGSNLGYMGYPESSCRKPYKPYSPISQYEADSYNEDMRRYVQCVKDYLENANNDIKRIREAMQNEVDKAKRDY